MNMRKGFTLIELLTTIAIIGLLSAAVLAGVGKARSKARDARRITDIQRIQTALELYFAAHGRYPCSCDCGAITPNHEWCNSVESLASDGRWISDSGARGALAPYLLKDPVDPAPKQITSITDPGGAYYYYSDINTTWNRAYMLVYSLENTGTAIEKQGGVTDCDGGVHTYGTGSNGIVTTGKSCWK